MSIWWIYTTGKSFIDISTGHYLNGNSTMTVRKMAAVLNLLQSHHLAFCRVSLLKLTSNATFLDWVCSTHSKWTILLLQPKIQSFITLMCLWKHSRQWRNCIFGVSLKKILIKIESTKPNQKELFEHYYKSIVTAISCLNGSPLPGGTGSYPEGKMEVLAYVLKVLHFTPLFSPNISSLTSILCSAGSLAFVSMEKI
jgi:hypothetical protein